MQSRALQSPSGCSPAACAGRDAAAAPAPPCGGSGNTAAPSRAGKMAPGSSRRLQGERCKPLLACICTHGTKTSPRHSSPPRIPDDYSWPPPYPLSGSDPHCPSQPRVSARPPFYPSPSPPPLPAAPPRPLHASRGQDCPRPAELRVPLLLLRHLSNSAANSHGHGLKNALFAKHGYRSFRRLARLRASPSRRFQNLPLRKDIQHPPHVATLQRRPDLRGRLKLSCNS